MEVSGEKNHQTIPTRTVHLYRGYPNNYSPSYRHDRNVQFYPECLRLRSTQIQISEKIVKYIFGIFASRDIINNASEREP